MAKKYSRKYSDSGMGWGWKLLIILMAITIIGGIALSFLYCDKIKMLGEKTNEETLEENIEQDENEKSQNVDINLNEANGIALAMDTIDKNDFSAWAIPEDAESAFKINMEVLPTYATNRKLVWAINFLPQTELEENRFIELTSQGYTLETFADLIVSEDTHSAIFVVKLPFGVHINITAKAESNPDVKVDIGADYALRWTGAKLTYQNLIDNGSTFAFDSTAKYLTIDSSWVDAYKGTISILPESTTATVAYGQSMWLEVNINSAFLSFCKNNYGLPVATELTSPLINPVFENGKEYSFTYLGLYAIDKEQAGLDEETTIEQIIDLYGNTFRAAVNAWTESFGEVPVYHFYMKGLDGVNCSHTSAFAIHFNYEPNTFTVDVENINPDTGDIVA